jgi:hypothetical protein
LLRRIVCCLLVALCPSVPSSAAEESIPDPAAWLPREGIDLQDRAAILDLIHVYSHLADGLHTELFGQFFTEDAVFSVVGPGVQAKSAARILGRSRPAIVAALRPRHSAFRREKVQRRHFLTNPIVWDQTKESARVAVYLQLVSVEKGGPPKIIGTGRYEGRAVQTPEGWRMAEWTIHSDQILE